MRKDEGRQRISYHELEGHSSIKETVIRALSSRPFAACREHLPTAQCIFRLGSERRGGGACHGRAPAASHAAPAGTLAGHSRCPCRAASLDTTPPAGKLITLFIKLRHL